MPHKKSQVKATTTEDVRGHRIIETDSSERNIVAEDKSDSGRVTLPALAFIAGTSDVVAATQIGMIFTSYAI